MFELDATFALYAIPAAFIAGFAKGGFGGSVAFAGTALLVLVYPPIFVLGVMLPLLMIVDLAMLKPYWKQWDADASWALVLGAIPGIGIGVLILEYADSSIIRLLIGIISIAFVLYQTANKFGLVTEREEELPYWMGLVAGAATGFTSYVSHAGGPPSAIYLLSKKLGKTAYQATTVFAFWFINGMKAVPYAFLGVFSYETLLADLILAPIALAASFLGVYAHKKIPDRVFFAVIYLFLLIIGVRLIFSGLA